MMEFFVLTDEFKPFGIIDTYSSVIWARRYNAVGDCELVLSIRFRELVKKDYYIGRNDDPMFCVIKKIDIQTGEDGDLLIVTASDISSILDQRVIWKTTFFGSNVETAIRTLVTNECYPPDGAGNIDGRRMVRTVEGIDSRLLYLDPANIPLLGGNITSQASYQNLGAKIREYCNQYQLGHYIRYNGATPPNNVRLYFGVFQGANRSGSICFSPKYDNIVNSEYSYDTSRQATVARVGGAGEGANRRLVYIGGGDSLNRYEIFVDAKDIGETMNYSDLQTTFSGGFGIWDYDTDSLGYRVPSVKIRIYTDEQLSSLQALYPGGNVITEDGVNYYFKNSPTFIAHNADGTAAADLTGSTKFVLDDIVYNPYLYERGLEKLAEYGIEETFEATIIPNVTYQYKQDYNLGDIVTIENGYVSAQARIIEAIEVEDDQGYSLELKVQYRG